MNENNFYNGSSPRAAEVDPTMRVAEAPIPSKLTEKDYFQKRFDELTSPSAAEVDHTTRAANPDESMHRSR